MIKKRWKVITNLSQPQRLDQPIVKSIKRTKAQYHFPRSTKERLLQGLIKTRRAICIILSPEGPPPPLLLKIQVTQANRQIDLSLTRFEFLPIGIYYMMISLSYTKNFEMAIFRVIVLFLRCAVFLMHKTGQLHTRVIKNTMESKAQLFTNSNWKKEHIHKICQELNILSLSLRLQL